MNYMISGKNIDVTEGLKQAIYDKLGRLEKFFTEDTKAQVTLSVEKERQKIEVTIPMKGHIIRAEQVSDDMYVSIDMVAEIIERQVVRYKKKIIDLRAKLQKEKDAKKKDNERYADYIKRATTTDRKAYYRKEKVSHSASHDRQIESIKREIERAKEALKREK